MRNHRAGAGASTDFRQPFASVLLSQAQASPWLASVYWSTTWQAQLAC